jgi:hypothetical protein
MIDDQVNAEELAESRRQRDIAPSAKDGLSVAPIQKPAAEGSQYRAPKQWIRDARKWLDAASTFRRP